MACSCTHSFALLLCVHPARPSSVELLGQLYEGRRGEMSGTVTVDEASGGGSTALGVRGLLSVQSLGAA